MQDNGASELLVFKLMAPSLTQFHRSSCFRDGLAAVEGEHIRLELEHLQYYKDAAVG